VEWLIKKQGGHNSNVEKRIREILRSLERRKIVLKSEFIPGTQNPAEEPWRQREENDWMINPEIAYEIWERWGTPEVDLFASRYNRLVEKFEKKSLGENTEKQ